MELQKATKIAESLCSVMSPFCEKILIAGSIRRQKPEVKDIEIVVLPKYSVKIPAELQKPTISKKEAKSLAGDFPLNLPSNYELFGNADKEDKVEASKESNQPQNLLYLWANQQRKVRWIKPGVSEIISWQVKPDGKYWRGLIESPGMDPIKLDLFIAGEDNFGCIATIRTGSREFSNAFMAYLKNRTPNRLQDGYLKVQETGTIIPCKTEEDFFFNSNVEWVPVEKRSSDNPHSLFRKVF